MIAMRIGTIGLDRLAAYARKFPSRARRVWYYVARKYRDELREVVTSGGGAHSVPKWAPLSSLTRALRRRTIPGGVLARADNIVMYRRGQTQIIGWRSSLAPYAEPFQVAARRGWRPDERRLLLAIARASRPLSRVVHAWLARGYMRPARPTIEPFARGHVLPTLAARVAQRLDKVLAS